MPTSPGQHQPEAPTQGISSGLFSLSWGSRRPRADASQKILDTDSVFTRIYLHPCFDTFILVVISSNCIWIGVDTDFNPSNRPDSELPPFFFELTESVFTFLFTVELLVRALSYKVKRDFFTDSLRWKWNLFDLFLVTPMILDVWIFTYILKVSGPGIKFLSVFRTLRLLRLTRIVRLVPELGMMLKSMMAALRTCLSTCVLCVLIMYVFALVLTRWSKSYDSDPALSTQGKCIVVEEGGLPVGTLCTAELFEDDACFCLADFFGTLPMTMLSLMQFAVVDDTFEVVRPVLYERWVYGALLITYILLVGFTVMNMLIGVICDVVKQHTDSEKEKLLRARVEERLKEVFQLMDADGSGQVSRQEFADSHGVANFSAFGMEPEFMKDAFDIMDTTPDGLVDLQEFTDTVFRCRAPPSAYDLLRIQLLIDTVADLSGHGKRATAILPKERGKVEGSKEVAPQAHSQRLRNGEAGAKKPLVARLHEVGRKLSALRLPGAAGEGNDSLGGVSGADLDAQVSPPSSEDASPTSRKPLYEHPALSDFPSKLCRSMSSSPRRSLSPPAISRQASPLSEDSSQPSLPPEGAMPRALREKSHAALATLLRVLTAQLHTLRAELRAAEILAPGGIRGSGCLAGPDEVAGVLLPPLRQVITDAITEAACVCRCLDGSDPSPLDLTAPLPAFTEGGNGVHSPEPGAAVFTDDELCVSELDRVPPWSGTGHHCPGHHRGARHRKPRRHRQPVANSAGASTTSSTPNGPVSSTGGLGPGSVAAVGAASLPLSARAGSRLTVPGAASRSSSRGGGVECRHVEAASIGGAVSPSSREPSRELTSGSGTNALIGPGLGRRFRPVVPDETVGI